MTKPHSTSTEEESLRLVEEIVAEITHALNSLGGKQYKGVFDGYRFWSSKHLHRAAEAFAFLRRSGRVDGTKFLMRPAVEMAFRLEAVKQHPNLLYRIAFSEHIQEKKFLNATAKHDQTPATITRSVDDKWKKFSDAFAKKFPKIPRVKKELGIPATAEKAGLQYVYDAHYRIYCQYTHGTLFASVGYFDAATDPEDNRAMAGCAMIALDALISLGAESPNRDELFARQPWGH
ncbi:MAG TPA: DUF5677 domain-containing protein [Nitrososphaera sp.]|nr:DUF5677 domain-containing protein [Nitrososphaera sp.]